MTDDKPEPTDDLALLGHDASPDGYLKAQLYPADFDSAEVHEPDHQ
jgi:hypothetical protein